MKIVKYTAYKEIIVEFQDDYNALVSTRYDHFLDGSVKNPYYPSVYGKGMIGNKYPSVVNGKKTKEYQAWVNILQRCFDKEYKDKHYTYKDVTCCKEWLLFENFYEWMHSQENFDKWLNNNRWAVDKDIIVKDNKTYSPNTCCLVPHNINLLFTKNNKCRGTLPIGVEKYRNKFKSSCMNPFTNKRDFLGCYETIEFAFQAYKEYKEYLIKQIAKIEFGNGNITRRCYDAMIKYIVKIDD